MRRSRRSESGAMAIELVILAPILLLILALIYGYGRASNVSGLLDAGARAAARTATQERSLEGARSASLETMRQTIEDQAPPDCVRSLTTDVEVADFGPGSPVTVDFSCTYPLSWALPGAPGTLTAHAEFTSVLDINREYE